MTPPSPTSPTPVGIDEMDRALALLDHELERLDLDEPLPIRAIGGYAMLRHGVREGAAALTADIDTVTRDYSAAVCQAIRTVGDRLGLDADWINNDNLGDNDPELIEAMYDARWEPTEASLKNIDLQVASIPTLTRAKIIATDTIESRRDNDIIDLMRLLKHQGITSMGQFWTKYPDPFDEYSNASALVGAQLSGKPPSLEDLRTQMDRDDELDSMLEDTTDDYGF